ncbi:MAG TPA: exo 1,3/1,4-beta-D-glucan glucohydrolase [Caulobacterales bacterium]|nr:exo 1,3/1,4-beta-D-glucan glucohydrolase [Caulobacterales bacterium]
MSARPTLSLRALLCGAATLVALSACSSTQTAQTAPAPAATAPAVAEADRIHPDIWPQGHSAVQRDPAIEARVQQILAQMTVEDKVGQIIQADVNSVTPDEVRQYHLGSVLNGGNSGPGGNDRAPAPVWLQYADQFYDASMQSYPGRIAIPVIWGSDSVHGNANIIGATIFPHNIGLGATHDPDLLRRIGEITAIETRVTGQDWTFAPTIAVVRDDRWGRTYEGYSEDPRIVAQYASAIVEGIQGRPGAADFLRGPHVIATAKHFLGDGGTTNGRDQGDNQYSEEQLRDIFAPGYPAAIGAGVQTVMASYNSWHGVKSHGNKGLLSDVLIGRFGLEGFVVGDWNGHSQVPGCAATNCAAAFNAGLDMFMAPDSWRDLYTNTLASVRSGEISMDRLNEAVSRILRVKLRAGVFEAGRPSQRPYGGQFDQLGSPDHRAVARQAVRESLVLLKNEDHILPLAARSNVLVAGSGADDMGKQTGGWTISWQGSDNSRADFPHAQTIWEGIRERVQAAGGHVTLSADGAYRGRKPDVAIVVFGEDPYAEFQGDRDNVGYQLDEPSDLELLQRLHAAGIPVISVFLSGRPLYVTPHINASNAFIAAWLPGSEGGGVADLLFRAPRGQTQYDFRGQLSYSWPRSPDQTPLNVGDANYNPLFAYGYGMSYAQPHNLGQLPEAPASAVAATNVARYIAGGNAPAPWTLALVDADGARTNVGATSASAQAPGIRVSRVDHQHQEDALLANWAGGARASLSVSGQPIDISRQSNGDMSLSLEVRVDAGPSGPVILAMSDGQHRGALDLTQTLRDAQGHGWTTAPVRLSCFAAQGVDMAHVTTPFELSSDAAVTVAVSTVRLAASVGPPSCPAAAH